MKISSKQLTQHLQRQLASLYLVSGDEILLVQETCSAIRTAAEQAGYQEKQRYYAQANFDWQELLKQVNSLSLFSQKRFIEIDLESLKFSASASKALQELVAIPATDTIILLKTAKLTAKLQTNAWYKAIDKHGICIAIWPLSLPEVRLYIKQHLQQAQRSTTPEAIEAMVLACEGNLLAVKQTIDKIQLLYPTGPLSYEQIVAAITDHAQFSIFDLIDALLMGQAERAIKVLELLKAEATEPLLVLWAITKELRQLLKLAFALNNATIETVLHQAFIRDSQKPLFKQCLQRHNHQQLQRLLQFSLTIDQMIKGLRVGNVWQALLTLSLALCGIAIPQTNFTDEHLL